MKRILTLFAIVMLMLALLPAQTAQAQLPSLTPVDVMGAIQYHGVGLANMSVRLCTPDCTADTSPNIFQVSPEGNFGFVSLETSASVLEVVPKPGYSFSSSPAVCIVPPAMITAQPEVVCSFSAFGTREVSGQILWSGTSNPAADVTVTLVPPPGHGLPAVLSDTTNAKGFFSIGGEDALDPNGLEPAAYTVNITPGELTYAPASGLSVDLSAGSAVYPIAVSHPAQILGGVYVHQMGNLVPGVTLTLTHPDGSTSAKVTPPDIEHVVFAGLMEGMKYKLTAAAPAGWEILAPSAVTINSLSAPEQTLEFSAVPTPYISGKVINQPAGFPTVVVTLQKADGSTMYHAITQPGGMFYLHNNGAGIPNGQYYVLINPVDSTPAFYYAPPLAVTISGASKKGLQISISPYKVAIRGQLYTQGGLVPYAEVGAEGFAGVPLAGATVKAERCLPEFISCTVIASAVSDTAGIYHLSLPTTEKYWYRITPFKTGYQFFNEEDEQPFIYMPFLLLQQYLHPNAWPNPNFAAFRAYSVSGKVSNGMGGAGLPGVTVTVSTEYNAATITRSAVTRADGTYTVKNVPDVGSSFVTAARLLNVPFPQIGILGRVSSNHFGYNFYSAKKFYAVSGIVTKSGLPLSGAMLTLDPVYEECMDYALPVRMQLTSADGKFKYPQVVAGCDYRLTITKYAYRFTGTVTSYPPSDNVVIPALAGNKYVKVAATMDKRNVNVILPPVVAAGAPVSVQYRQLPSGAWKTFTMVGGAPYVLKDLYVAYAYEFKPTAADYLFDPAVVTLAGNYTYDITLPALPAVSLSGRVLAEGRIVPGVMITPNSLSRPAYAVSSSLGKYSLLLPQRTEPDDEYELTLSHKYFTFPVWYSPDMLVDEANFDLSQAKVEVKGRVVTRAGFGLGGVKVCADPETCTYTNAQGYYYLLVYESDAANLWSFAVRPKLAGKTFTPSYRPVSPTYGKSSKNFVVNP